MNYHDIGDVVRLLATFTNSAGNAVDPSTVTLQHKVAAHAPLSFTTLIYTAANSLIRASVGVYYHDLPVNSYGGEWKYRWNGLGSNAAAAEGAFQVRWNSVG